MYDNIMSKKVDMNEEEPSVNEVKGGGEEVADEGGVVHELAKEDAKVLRGKVARVVQEIDEVGRVMI